MILASVRLHARGRWRLLAGQPDVSNARMRLDPGQADLKVFALFVLVHGGHGLEAPEYCGYSGSQFAALTKKYPLPRYGPSQPRYRIADLDAWMERPDDFTPTARRPKVSEWKPVAV